MSIKIIDTWDKFFNLSDAWHELDQASNCGPFASFTWLDCWRTYFGGKVMPYVITEWRDGLLVGIVPAGISNRQLSRRFPSIRQICLHMLSDQHSGFADWIIEPDHHDVINGLVQHLRSNKIGWHYLQMEPLKISIIHDRVHQEMRDCLKSPPPTPSVHSVMIDSSRGWDTYFNSRSTSFRRQINRAIKFRKDDWTIESTTNGIPEQLFQEIFTLSTNSWKGKHGGAIGSEQKTRQLYQALGQYSDTNPLNLQSHILRINGIMAGAFISITCKGVAYALKSYFAEDFAHYSPGRLMLRQWVKTQCDTNNINQCDLLRRSHFTDSWKTSSYTMNRLRAYPGFNLSYLWHSTENLVKPLAKCAGINNEKMKPKRNKTLTRNNTS